MNRRAWLLGLASVAVGSRAIGGKTIADDPALLSAKARAKEAGLDLSTTEGTRHYLSIGDASADYQKQALKLCEDLAADFLGHFRAKKFEVELPKAPMLVVILKGPAEFAAFLRSDPGDAVGGIFDIDADRLVVLDNRSRQGLGRQGRANTLSLFHEATHQLAYDAGLLRREGDVPTAINEGFGVYGEVRTADGRRKIGAPNIERFPELRAIGKSGWIETSRLIVDDDGFDGEAAAQAYAQAWLLVYHLLKTPARTPQFRDYLRAIAPRKDAAHRVDDARAAFGDLEALDKELKSALGKLLRA